MRPLEMLSNTQLAKDLRSLKRVSPRGHDTEFISLIDFCEIVDEAAIRLEALARKISK